MEALEDVEVELGFEVCDEGDTSPVDACDDSGHVGGGSSTGSSAPSSPQQQQQLQQKPSLRGYATRNGSAGNGSP